MRELAAWPDRTELAADLLAQYRAGYLTRLNAYLSAKANCASWFITGRANFPVRQQEKRWASADRRSEELAEYTNTRLTRLLRIVSRPPRATAAERADDLRRRIANAQAAQEMMKEANKIIKSKRLADQLAKHGMTVTDALVGLGLRHSIAVEIQSPDFAGRVGFPNYALTNNGAEINRLKKRLEDEQAKALLAEIGPITKRYVTPNDGEIEYEVHPDDNRIRLSFEGKPSEATRALLKRNGFKWSPSNGAWQRFMTGSGQYATQQVLKALGAEEAPEAEAVDFAALAADVKAQQAARVG